MFILGPQHAALLEKSRISKGQGQMEIPLRRRKGQTENAWLAVLLAERRGHRVNAVEKSQGLVGWRDSGRLWEDWS